MRTAIVAILALLTTNNTFASPIAAHVEITTLPSPGLLPPIDGVYTLPVTVSAKAIGSLASESAEQEYFLTIDATLTDIVSGDFKGVVSQKTRVLAGSKPFIASVPFVLARPEGSGLLSVDLNATLVRRHKEVDFEIGNSSSHITLTLPSFYPEGAVLIDPAIETSAFIVNDDGSFGPGVVVPAGAASTPIYLALTTDTTTLEANPLDGGFGPTIVLEPDLQFSSPVTLVIPYDDSIAYERRYREANLILDTLSENYDWIPVTDVTVDYIENRIYAKVWHFSRYVACGSLASYEALAATLRSDFETLASKPRPQAHVFVHSYNHASYNASPYTSYYLQALGTYYGRFYDSSFAHTAVKDTLPVRGIVSAIDLLSMEAINYHFNVGLSWAEILVKLTQTGTFPITTKETNPLYYPRGWGLQHAFPTGFASPYDSAPPFTMYAYQTGVALNGLADFTMSLARYEEVSGRRNVTLKVLLQEFDATFGTNEASKLRSFRILKSSQTYRDSTNGSYPGASCFIALPSLEDSACFLDLETMTLSQFATELLGYQQQILEYWSNYRYSTAREHSSTNQLQYFAYANAAAYNLDFGARQTDLFNVFNTSNAIATASAKYGVLSGSPGYSDVARSVASEFREHWVYCDNYLLNSSKAAVWVYGKYHDDNSDERGDDFGHAALTVGIVAYSEGVQLYDVGKWDVFSKADLNSLKTTFTKFYTIKYLDQYKARHSWKKVNGNCYTPSESLWLTKNPLDPADQDGLGPYTDPADLSNGSYATSESWARLGWFMPEIWEIHLSWLNQYYSTTTPEESSNAHEYLLASLASMSVVSTDYYLGQLFVGTAIKTVAAAVACLVGAPCNIGGGGGGCSVSTQLETSDGRGVTFVFLFLFLLFFFLPRSRRRHLAVIFLSLFFIQCNEHEDNDTTSTTDPFAESVASEIGDTLKNCLQAISTSPHQEIIGEYIAAHSGMFSPAATSDSFVADGATISWGKAHTPELNFKSSSLVFSFLDDGGQLIGKVNDLHFLRQNIIIGTDILSEVTSTIRCDTADTSYSVAISFDDVSYSFKTNTTSLVTDFKTVDVCRSEDCRSFSIDSRYASRLVNSAMTGIGHEQRLIEYALGRPIAGLFVNGAMREVWEKY